MSQKTRTQKDTADEFVRGIRRKTGKHLSAERLTCVVLRGLRQFAGRSLWTDAGAVAKLLQDTFATTTRHSFGDHYIGPLDCHKMF